MTGDIIRCRKEFFEDLLEEFTEDSEVDLFFQAEVVRKLLSYKALGVDEICPHSGLSMLWGCLGWHASVALHGSWGQCSIPSTWCLTVQEGLPNQSTCALRTCGRHLTPSLVPFFGRCFGSLLMYSFQLRVKWLR